MNRRNILITAAAALVLRLAYVFFYGADPLNPDSLNYLAIAKNLLASGSFSLDGIAPTMSRAPGYPLFIAATGLLTGGVNIKAVLAAQAVLDSATAVYVLLLAARFVPAGWALAAGLFYALHPVFTGFSGMLLSESLFMHFWLLFLLSFRRGLEDGRLTPWALAGLALALGVLTRPAHMFYPLPAAFLLAIRRPGLKAAVAGFAIFLAAAAATMTPWVIRNYRVSGLFVTVATGGSAAVWLGSMDHFPNKADIDAVWPGPDYKSPEAERAFAAAAKKNWQENRRRILLHLPYRLRKFWVTSHSSVFRVEMPNAYYRALVCKTLLLALQVLTLAGGLAGAWILRRRWQDALFLLMPAAYVSAHILNDWGPGRYHLSALPCLAITALWGLREVLASRAAPR